jgi:hypothetical protein
MHLSEGITTISYTQIGDTVPLLVLASNAILSCSPLPRGDGAETMATVKRDVAAAALAVPYLGAMALKRHFVAVPLKIHLLAVPYLGAMALKRRRRRAPIW